MSENKGIWQLPIIERVAEWKPDWVHPNAKFHYFVEDESICGKYVQATGLCETDLGRSRLTLEDAVKEKFVCKKCYKKISCYE